MPVPAASRNGAVELVVTDLDGTLSDAEERIHPASARAVRALQVGGVPVLVATGRRRRMAAASSAHPPPAAGPRSWTWSAPPPPRADPRRPSRPQARRAGRVSGWW